MSPQLLKWLNQNLNKLLLNKMLLQFKKYNQKLYKKNKNNLRYRLNQNKPNKNHLLKQNQNNLLRKQNLNKLSLLKPRLLNPLLLK